MHPHLDRKKDIQIKVFGKKIRQTEIFDRATQKPVIKCSICTGEQVAGFKDLNTGIFTDIMLLRGDDDLLAFKERYGITEEIGKIY